MFTRLAITVSLAIFALTHSTWAQNVITITQHRSVCSAVYTSASTTVTVIQSTVTVTPSSTSGAPSASTSAPSDTALNAGATFAIEVAPGTWLTLNGSTTTNSSLAAQYTISNGGLYSATTGLQISANPSDSTVSLAPSAAVGSITCCFSFVNGVLTWTNQAFANGAATFYASKLGDGGSVVASLKGSQPQGYVKVVVRAAAPPGGSGVASGTMSVSTSYVMQSMASSAPAGGYSPPPPAGYSSTGVAGSSSQGVPTFVYSPPASVSPTSTTVGVPGGYSSVAGSSSAVSSKASSTSAGASMPSGYPVTSASSSSSSVNTLSTVSAPGTPIGPDNPGYSRSSTSSSPAVISISTPAGYVASTASSSRTTASTSTITLASATPSASKSSTGGPYIATENSSQAPGPSSAVMASPSTSARGGQIATEYSNQAPGPSSPAMTLSSTSSLGGQIATEYTNQAPGSTFGTPVIAVSSTSRSSSVNTLPTYTSNGVPIGPDNPGYGGSTVASSSSASSSSSMGVPPIYAPTTTSTSSSSSLTVPPIYGPTTTITSSSSSSVAVPPIYGPTTTTTTASSSSFLMVLPIYGPTNTTTSSSSSSAVGPPIYGPTTTTTTSSTATSSSSSSSSSAVIPPLYGPITTTTTSSTATSSSSSSSIVPPIYGPTTTTSTSSTTSRSSSTSSPFFFTDYMTSSSQPFTSPPASTTSSTSSATPPSSTIPACPSGNNTLFSDSGGAVYRLLCDIDSLPGSYNSAAGPNFQGCLGICDDDTQCTAVAFNGQVAYGGTCYFKTSVQSYASSPGVYFALLVSPAPAGGASSSATSSVTSKSSTSSTATAIGPTVTTTTSSTSSSITVMGPTITTTTTSTSTSSTSSSSSSPPAATATGTNAFTCAANNGQTITDAAGIQYIISCGSESSSGSYASYGATTSFNDCFNNCDINYQAPGGTNCTAFTYFGGNNGVGGGTCFVKNELGETFLPGNAQLVGVIKMAYYVAQSSSSVAVVSTTSTTSSTTSTAPQTTTSSAPLSSSSASTSTSTLTSTGPYLVLPSPTPCDFGDPPNYDEDDSYCEVDLPFNAQIYSTTSQKTYASTNGYISLLQGSSQYSTRQLPAPNIPNNTVVPLFDDLFLYGPPPTGTGVAGANKQGIWYQIQGSAVVWEYYVARGGDATSVYHFTVAYDSNLPGTWRYKYYSIGTSRSDAGANGASAAVGMQGLGANGAVTATQYSFRNNVITPGLVLTCSGSTSKCTAGSPSLVTVSIG
ncbi:hypothetical protein B0A48_03059 [Cryoendolithus antarcticus]|uniref:DUF7908 domain-containing protein n=1 Tax=Cryoendolithus antarcticus TaxID=1507870 RepID=A0A1V8TM08_9PEZI|nr:hypothetical protein B0A48_03059 [Cryoendolithus antarcticus]